MKANLICLAVADDEHEVGLAEAVAEDVLGDQALLEGLEVQGGFGVFGKMQYPLEFVYFFQLFSLF